MGVRKIPMLFSSPLRPLLLLLLLLLETLSTAHGEGVRGGNEVSPGDCDCERVLDPYTDSIDDG